MMRLEKGRGPAAVIIIGLLGGLASLPSANAGGGYYNYSTGPTIASTLPFPDIPGERPITQLDPTVFSMADAAMATIASGVHDAIAQRLSRFKNASIAAARAAPLAGDGASGNVAANGTVGEFTLPVIGGWTQVFGLSNDTSGGKPFDKTNGFSGATVGFDLPLSQNVIAGFFFGGSTGALTDSSADRDVSTNGFYGGLYFIQQVGDIFVDLAIGGGRTEQNTRRYDFDLQDAKASYVGYFVNPSLTFSTHGKIGNQLIVPSFSAIYTGFFYDDYSEKGSPQSLKVSGRQTHLMNGRAQIAVPYEHVFFSGSKLIVEGRGGIDARFDLSGQTMTSTQGGLQFTFRPDDKARELGAFLGAEATYTLKNGVLFYGEVEGIITSTGSLNAYTQFGTRFAF